MPETMNSPWFDDYTEDVDDLQVEEYDTAKPFEWKLTRQDLARLLHRLSDQELQSAA
jgi:hypothetical protein